MSSSSTARLSIGEVVALLRPEFGDLTDSKIRFLEDRKLISPARTPAGYRAFGPHDIEVLRWILTCQRDQYLPLSVIGERIARGEHLEDIWGIGASELLAAEISEPEAGELRVTAPEQADQSGVTDVSSDADAPADESVSAVIESTSVGLAAAGLTAAGPTAIGSAASTQPPWMAVGDEPSYSAHDLSAQSGLDIEEIEELIQFGLLVPLSVAEQARSVHAQSGRSHAAPAPKAPAPNAPAPNAPVPEAPAPNAPATADAAASTATPTDAVQATLGLEPAEPRYGGGALLIARISREFATYGLRARHLRVIRNAAVRDASVFEQSVQPVLHAGGTSTERDAQRSLSRLIALCERLRSVVFGEALRRYWR